MIELIKLAVKQAQTNLSQAITYEYEEALGPEAYAKEFKTIHINTGRMTGKTSAIMTLSRSTDLIIVHNYWRVQQLRKTYPNFIGTINTIEDIVLGAKGFPKTNKPIRRYDYVWIDEPRLCSRTEDSDADYVDLVYKYTRANLYIKLGE